VHWEAFEGERDKFISVAKFISCCGVKIMAYLNTTNYIGGKKCVLLLLVLFFRMGCD
jgi:hypothetical protein